MDAAGNIFGVTSSTVFELSPNGNGGWNSTVIHTFTGAPKDGSAPQGALVLDQAGNLYGTTTGGGTKNSGTVFKMCIRDSSWLISHIEAQLRCRRSPGRSSFLRQLSHRDSSVGFGAPQCRQTIADSGAVSYTHLDVYKRQTSDRSLAN